jgi:hypothetical protein
LEEGGRIEEGLEKAVPEMRGEAGAFELVAVASEVASSLSLLKMNLESIRGAVEEARARATRAGVEVPELDSVLAVVSVMQFQLDRLTVALSKFYEMVAGVVFRVLDVILTGELCRRFCREGVPGRAGA